MALSDKNIVITPNIGQSADPQIVFSGADASTTAQNITLKAYPTNNGTISFEGSNGQLFSIANSITGTIYSVNDGNGIPSIEVLDTGVIKLAQYSGNVLIGTATDDGVNKLQVNGPTKIFSTTTSTTSTSGALVVAGGVGIAGATNIAGIVKLTAGVTSSSYSDGTLIVSGGVGISGNLNVGGTITGTSTISIGTDVTVSGNLTVNGTTTTINSNTLTVDDKNIDLGSVPSAVIASAGTVGSISGTGPWTAVITGMTATTGLLIGSTISATAGTGTLYGGTPTSCLVTSLTSTSVNYTVTGGTTPTAGTISAISTTGANNTTADGGGITLKGTTDKTFNWVNSTGAWTSSEHINLATGKAYYINGTSVLTGSTLGSGVTSSSLATVGTITTGTWSASFGTVSGATLTSLTAGNLSGTIPSAVLGNSTLYIGTTAIALNRANANQALTGITSIDGSAGSVAYSLTINSGGTGDSSGSTYNGSAAKTISHNSIGASPLAGSSSLTTTGVVSTGTWSSALDGETFSTAASIVAGTNTQGQGALTKDYNVITTTAANPSGVTLPIATVGRRIIIINRGTNPISIFPASSAYIDSLSVNAAISLAVGGYIEFNAYTTTNWLSSTSTQTANYVFAAPSGSAGYPSFRALVAADIPTLNQSTSGLAATATRLTDSTGVLRIANPGGAAMGSQPASFSGVIKIKLPVAAFNSSTMVSMTVNIFDYTGSNFGTSRRLYIGGYNYSGDGKWYNYFATQLSAGGGDIKVRFGKDTTSNAIYIGDPTAFGAGTVSSISPVTGGWTATLVLTSTAGMVTGTTISATAGTGVLYGGTATSCIVNTIQNATTLTYTVLGPSATTPVAGGVTAVTATGSPWSYVSCSVTDVQASQSGVSDSLWGTGWVISTITSFASETIAQSNGDATVYSNTSTLAAVTARGATTGTAISITNGTSSSSSSTGALVITGGLGVGNNVNVGGNIAVAGTTDSSSSTTGALTVAGGAGIAKNLVVGGTITANGLSMTSGTSVDQLLTVTDSLSLTTAWQDTSVNAAELATGTYVVQILADDYTVGGGQYTTYYSGIMSWFSTNTNAIETDEIILHRAGHASNNGTIFLRIIRTVTADASDLKLQIAGTTVNTGVSNYTYKFRRLI